MLVAIQLRTTLDEVAVTLKFVGSTSLTRRACRRCARGDGLIQVLSRYPVLKIHATMASDIARNARVMARLTSTLISALP